MNGFKTVEIKDLQFNPFTLIDKEWMLITAGNEQKCNTMTASWGGLGELWKHYVSFIFVRPQRYTLEFIEKEDHYSLCFFDESYRKALSFCGSHSGRDYDKCKETGLTPDESQTQPGRGWYVCSETACREKFRRFRTGGRKRKGD